MQRIINNYYQENPIHQEASFRMKRAIIPFDKKISHDVQRVRIEDQIKVNKKVLEALIKCGAFDSSDTKRSQMMAIFEDALEHGSRIQKEKADSQLDLFADSNMGTALPVSRPKFPDINEWEDNVLLSLEKESLGFYISGHPLDKYEKTIQKYATVTSANIHDMADGKMIRMGGSVKILKLHKTKKGDMMAFAAIEDQAGSIEVVVFPNLYAKAHMLLADEEIVILEAEVQKKENIVKLVAESIVPIEQASHEWTNGVLIKVNAQEASSDTLEKLKSIIENHPGDCTACLKIEIENNPPVLVKLSDDYRTDFNSSFFTKVEKLLGASAIETTCTPVKEKQKRNKPWLNKQNKN